MELLIKIALVLLVVAAGRLIRKRDAQRVAAMDAQGACLSCFSTDVAVRGQRARCNNCGFEFGADRGGALTARELESLAPQDPGEAFGRR